MRKIYTLLDNDGFVINSTFFKEGEQPNNSVEELVTESFVKARFDFETRTFFEAATQEEINDYNKSLVPTNIRSRQLRLALIYNGFNLDSITAVINSLDEPTRSIALTEWEYATSFDRNNELLTSLGQMLGLTEVQIDDIFILANTL